MSLLLALQAGGTTVSPGVGDATWTGFAPQIVIPVTILCFTGEAIWTGFAPTIRIGTALPDTGAVVIVNGQFVQWNWDRKFGR